MAPRWSPHGQRIAYWTRRGETGQRDLFTVAADGSQAQVPATDATNDAALDWSPEWSPDGRFLYFSSNRGGTMNQWRLPIDEASGKVTGEAQPVTVPAAWSGSLTFARDGRHFAYATRDWRTRLMRAPLDLRALTLGPPQVLIETGKSIRDHSLSPDGKSVVVCQIGDEEDIAIARLDGSSYLRLTDDAYRDRGPTWSPDGKDILFYSDRGGSYELWRIHPDGSGLRQFTRSGPGPTNFPQWSPDGLQVSYSRMGTGWYLVDSRTDDAPARAMPGLDSGATFWPYSWSPDGRRIVGLVGLTDGSNRGLAVYTLASERFESLTAGTAGMQFAVWLADSRHVVVRDQRGIAIVDSTTRQSRPVVTVGGYWTGESVGAPADGASITWTETATQGDLWLADLETPAATHAP
jgi:Tol biopolymer transport system component